MHAYQVANIHFIMKCWTVFPPIFNSFAKNFSLNFFDPVTISILFLLYEQLRFNTFVLMNGSTCNTWNFAELYAF